MPECLIQIIFYSSSKIKNYNINSLDHKPLFPLLAQQLMQRSPGSWLLDNKVCVKIIIQLNSTLQQIDDVQSTSVRRGFVSRHVR